MHFTVIRQAIFVMVVGMTLTAAAQTNSCPEYTRWLIIPEPQLRTESTEPLELRSDRLENQVGLSSLPGETKLADLKMEHSNPNILNVDRGDQWFESYYLRQQDFGFVRTIQVSDGTLGRAFDSVFRPEEFRVGKTTTVSCSILTAIKRKNPFCLLNPIFLNVSW